MRPLKKLDMDVKDVFQSCLGSMRDERKVEKLQGNLAIIETLESEFKSLAVKQYFHEIESKHELEIDAGGIKIEAKELLDLYSNQFLGNKGPRRYYEEIKNMHNYCAYCYCGIVDELDHYLPKDQFFLLCITPVNLLPVCSRCNKLKGEYVSESTSKQIIHVGFELKELFCDQWLYMKLEMKSGRPIFNYYAKPPASWSEELASRLMFHFEKLNLAERYYNFSSSEYSSYSSVFQSKTIDLKWLETSYESNRDHSKNFWKTIFYHAFYQYYKP